MSLTYRTSNLVFIILSLFTQIFYLHSQESVKQKKMLIHKKQIPNSSIRLTTKMHLQHALTKKEMIWGMMRKTSLEENSGMSFTYASPAYLNVWMFNCFLDLSLAFINEQRVIEEIHDLKAYPEKMDPKRAILSLKDFSQYQMNDPIIQFFQKHSIQSKVPCLYIVEMHKNFFRKNSVQPGDIAIFSPSSPKGIILHSFDISPYIVQEDQATIFTLEQESPIAIWILDKKIDSDVILLDQTMKVLEKKSLKSAFQKSFDQVDLIYSPFLVKYIFTTKEKEIENMIEQGQIAIENGRLVFKNIYLTEG